MNRAEAERLYKWLECQFVKNGLDIQTFDFWNEIDLTLDYWENKNILIDKVRERYNVNLDLERELRQAMELKELYEREMAKSVEAEAIEKLKSYKGDFISDKFEKLHYLIDAVVKGYINGLLVYGSGGFGKSFNVINSLNKLNADYVYVTGQMTPLALYKFLFENRDKIIVFDDVEVFDDELCISILKSALWEVNNVRIVCYNSTAKEMELLPSRFEFKGRIIFIENAIDLNDRNIRALIDRLITFEINFTKEEVLVMCEKILDSFDVNKEAILEYLKSFDGLISFRTLVKLVSLYKYAKDSNKDFFELAELVNDEIDENLRIALELYKSYGDRKGLVKDIWIEKTGLSMRTYYRKLRELRKRGLVS